MPVRVWSDFGLWKCRVEFAILIVATEVAKVRYGNPTSVEFLVAVYRIVFAAFLRMVISGSSGHWKPEAKSSPMWSLEHVIVGRSAEDCQISLAAS